MNLDDLRAMLADQHHGVIATSKPSGGIQMSPVLVSLDAEDRVIISSRQGAYKVRNLRGDPRVFVCLLPDGFFGKWLQVDGTASILDLPDAMDPLIDYYRRTSGEHSDWDEYRAAMEAEQRVLIRIDIERIGPHRSG
ncbi:MAG TPA: PPOX class F420-dependent oxidoreductase [Actinoplanes sp.]|nr:PPOX class F420-dependent oxidoreductase [Actinoplanes sp.]